MNGGERGIRTLDGAFDPILPKQGSAFDQLGHLSSVQPDRSVAAKAKRRANPISCPPPLDGGACRLKLGFALRRVERSPPHPPGLNPAKEYLIRPIFAKCIYLCSRFKISRRAPRRFRPSAVDRCLP